MQHDHRKSLWLYIKKSVGGSRCHLSAVPLVSGGTAYISTVLLFELCSKGSAGEKHVNFPTYYSVPTNRKRVVVSAVRKVHRDIGT